MYRKRMGLSLLLCFFLLFSSFYIEGFPNQVFSSVKKVTSIRARYGKAGVADQEGNFLVGTKLDLQDFIVTRTFDNGETDEITKDALNGKCELVVHTIPFDSLPFFVTKIKYIGDDKLPGEEIVTDVSFQTTNLKLKAITAAWQGKTKYHIGDSLKKNEISVDGTYDTYDKLGGLSVSTKSIRVENVTFEPETITFDGDNYIKASFRGFSSTFKVRGYGSKGLKIEYTGPKTVVVGQHIDKKKVKVSELFSSGELKKVDDFTIDDTLIKQAGTNVFTITYGKVTGQFSVTGIDKAPEKISAKYEGGDLVVGSMIDLSKVIVTVTYNDKTTEVLSSGFTIKPDKVVSIGSNTVTVFYKGLRDTVNIKATEILPGSIVAVYNGGMVIEGSRIKRPEINVTAYFPDGKSKTITDFELSTETMNTVGIQEVIVTYKGVKASIYVPVTAKTVTSISAVYKGGALIQHSSIDRKDIVVTATYNDGTTANVSDYTISNTVAVDVGRNVFSIFYGGKTKDLIVEALPRLILGRGTLTADVSGEDYSTKITAFIENQYVREGIQLETESVEKADIEKAVKRVHKTKKFLAFEMLAENFQFDENGYMITEVTIPQGMNPANVGVFYTPDKKKVMVQMTGGLVSSELYRFYAYRGGTYVIMEKAETDIGRQELREDDNRTPFLVASLPNKMKVKEKRGIKPFLLFANFTNDGFLYESGDEDVLTVSKEGLITAKAPGEASITVSSSVGGYSMTYDIEVTR